MSDWDAWVGRETVQSDLIDSALAKRWRATFDRDANSGDALPQGFHFCLCTPDAATADLGADGHPKRDDNPSALLPPIPLPRRMWAASDIHFLSPLGRAQTGSGCPFVRADASSPCSSWLHGCCRVV